MFIQDLQQNIFIKIIPISNVKCEERIKLIIYIFIPIRHSTGDSVSILIPFMNACFIIKVTLNAVKINKQLPFHQYLQIFLLILPVSQIKGAQRSSF